MPKNPNSNSKKQRGLLYIDRNSLAYYSKSNQKPHLLELGIDIIKDMEIESPDKFVQTLAGWMDSNKISPSDVVIVLSVNMYFEHAVQSLAGGDADDREIELFLGTVPFAQCVRRTVQDGASKRAVVVNRDYCDLLIEFLEKRNFRVLALFPISLLKVNSPEEVKLDHLVNNLDDFKKFNLTNEMERKVAPQSFIAKNTPRDTKNLKIMMAFFGLLMVVLAVMIYLNFYKK